MNLCRVVSDTLKLCICFDDEEKKYIYFFFYKIMVFANLELFSGFD